MADPLIGADLDLALDVLLDIAAQVTLDLELLVDEAANASHLVIGELTHLGARVDPGALADEGGPAVADAVDVGQADGQPLVARQVNSGYACHQPITPASACGAGWGRSPRPAHGGG